MVGRYYIIKNVKGEIMLRKLGTLNLFIFIFIVFFGHRTSNAVMPYIVNYSNDANLQKAFEYDLTMDETHLNQEEYDSLAKRVSQKLAEEHYLAYLEDVNDSFQRSRVYVKLGNLFGGAVDQKVILTGVIDNNKANNYYRKALIEEPNRIGIPTLAARAGLTSATESLENQFYLCMDYYQWLLSIDKKTLNKNWLPFTPNSGEPSEKTIEEMIELIEGVKETTALNLAYDARHRLTNNSELFDGGLFEMKYLIEIIERFPQTKAAELAGTELEDIVTRIGYDFFDKRNYYSCKTVRKR